MLTLFAAGDLRLAILICEDLGRLIDVGPVIREVGLSHLLVPVLSRPIKRRRWEETAAAALARETGVSVIVANSMAIGSILGDNEGASALALSSRSCVVARATGPAEPVVLRVHGDGTIERD
jgi:predicted amidohydrolase